MKVQINFKIINPDYDQRYADEYHFGDESDGNWKYLGAVRYLSDNVESVEVIEHEDFLLKGRLNDGSAVEFRIPDMRIYRCHLEDGGRKDYAVSKSILNQTYQAEREKYPVTRFYFYINPEPPFVQLATGIFVNESHVPQELRKIEIGE